MLRRLTANLRKSGLIRHASCVPHLGAAGLMTVAVASRSASETPPAQILLLNSALTG